MEGLILFVARVFEHNEDVDDMTSEAATCSFEYNEIFVSAASEAIGFSFQ